MHNKDKKGLTTIRIKKITRAKLLELGKKGDTYDDIINELIDEKK